MCCAGDTYVSQYVFNDQWSEDEQESVTKHTTGGQFHTKLHWEDWRQTDGHNDGEQQQLTVFSFYVGCLLLAEEYLCSHGVCHLSLVTTSAQLQTQQHTIHTIPFIPNTFTLCIQVAFIFWQRILFDLSFVKFSTEAALYTYYTAFNCALFSMLSSIILLIAKLSNI